MSESFLDGRVIMHAGDCLDALTSLEECSIDSCVTDPPYHLTSIVKRMSAEDAKPVGFGSDGRYQRLSGGFMGKLWDGGDIAFRPELWREVYRVLKPGAHLLAFGGTRTYHRMACAIEDAGFEIRDSIQWLYGSGFPKSHDVSKGIDKNHHAEKFKREVIGLDCPPIEKFKREVIGRRKVNAGVAFTSEGPTEIDITIPTTASARQWEGWGTALKPACEPIVLSRKPLSESTVAANVLRWGTGALNIGGCRVHANEGSDSRSSPQANGREGEISANRRYTDEGSTNFAATPGPRGGSSLGRWPANLIHDGSEEVVGAFPDAPGQRRYTGPEYGKKHSVNCYGEYGPITAHEPRGDSGSAARFFYTSKADSDDRLGSKHPTVKPLDLMQYLVRLITPPEGLCLDPFAGTGTTGEAAFREGMSAVLIEREAEYQDDIRRRMALVLGGPDERSNATSKQRMKDKPPDHGPLFAKGKLTNPP